MKGVALIPPGGTIDQMILRGKGMGAETFVLAMLVSNRQAC